MTVKQRLLPLAFCLLIGCGYTTRSSLYDSNTIIVKPAVNKIDITSEGRRYTRYVTFPILIENRLTNVLITKFNIDGGLKVVNIDPQALQLACTVTNYRKETLRYTETDDVKEQRLRLHVRMTLKDSEGTILKDKVIVGESSFFLVGPNQKSEEAAQIDLIDDTARRIVEAVVEEW